MDAAVHSLIAGYLNDSSEKTALFGHSMGGVLAFEIARVLTKIGRPRCLFISGANTPDYQEDTWDVQSMNDEQFLNHLAKIGGFQKEFFDNPAYQAYFCRFYGRITLFCVPVPRTIHKHSPVESRCLPGWMIRIPWRI